jgi:hypothetical protein
MMAEVAKVSVVVVVVIANATRFAVANTSAT